MCVAYIAFVLMSGLMDFNMVTSVDWYAVFVNDD